MIKTKNLYTKLFKYILLFIVGFFCMAFSQTTLSYAAAPRQVTFSDLSGMNGYRITSNTCKTWKKPGVGCSVSISSQGTTGSECSLTSVLTFNFTNNGSKFDYGSYKPTGHTASSYCRYSGNAKVYNYDSISPNRRYDYATIKSGTCTESIAPQGATLTCVGSVTAQGRFGDSESGIQNDSVTTTCYPGQTCKIYGTDNVGNKSSDSVGLSNNKAPWTFNIKADTTKCSRVTGSIYSGTKYNGWYVGTVKCSARCTADNLAIGGTKYGSTTGRQCCAQACDKAGNCKSVCQDVPRDYNPPTCSHRSISSDGLLNNYRMGKVTVSWGCTDSQSGCKNGTYTQSTLNNHTTSLSQTVTDKAGNVGVCTDFSWARDTRAPSGCNFSLTDFSNSSITATAWCSSDGESGCSPDRKYKTYYDNGNYTGGNGISVYDMTEKFNATPKNYMNCPINVNKIDRVAPTCSATTSIANPVLAADGKAWSTNTWHNNADVVYDENGNATSNSKKRVQGYLNTTYDNASAGGNASGIKSGFTGGTALGSLNQEARTEYNDGSQNGLYTIFSRDKVVDNVTNNLRGWSGSTLYAHGVTTSGNVGTCQAQVYSFDNNKNSFDIIR